MKYRIILMVVLAFNIHFSQAQVGIGTTSPTSTLSVEGSFSTKFNFLFADTTLDNTNHTVTGNNITITLPSPNSMIGREYIIKAGNTGNLIVIPTGTDQIDGSNTSITLDAYEILKIKAIGSGFWIILKEKSSGVEDGDAWGVNGEDSSSDIYRSGDVGIGTSGTPNSALQVDGSFSLPIKSISSSYSLLDTDHTIISRGADVTLPSANGRKGRIYIIKNVSSSSDLTVSTSGSDEIDGEDELEIESGKGQVFTLQSDGADWWIISDMNDDPF